MKKRGYCQIDRKTDNKEKCALGQPHTRDGDNYNHHTIIKSTNTHRIRLHREKATIDTLHYVNEVSLKQFTGHCTKPLYSKVCKQKRDSKIVYITLQKHWLGKLSSPTYKS